MANRILELRRQLFDPGKVSITAEAFQRLKTAQIEPRRLLERHARGDWDGAPAGWIEKNDLRFRGVKDNPVLSVYQLHPSEHRVCVATDADFSETSITNWPDGDHKARLAPLEAMEAGYQVAKRAMGKSCFARSLMDNTRTASKGPDSPKGGGKPRGRSIPR